jgi:hypothetical protein
MMCAGKEERIARYVGGDLAPEDSAELERHLRDCSECGELARAMERDAEWLASRPPELAEVDFAAMRREIRREITRPRWSWRWVVAAAAAFVLVGALTYIDPPRKPYRPAVAIREAAAPSPAPPPAKVAAVAPKRTRRPRRIEPVPPQTNSPVTIRIATRDPNVTIILLHESKGALE